MSEPSPGGLRFWGVRMSDGLPQLSLQPWEGPSRPPPYVSRSLLGFSNPRVTPQRDSDSGGSRYPSLHSQWAPQLSPPDLQGVLKMAPICVSVTSGHLHRKGCIPKGLRFWGVQIAEPSFPVNPSSLLPPPTRGGVPQSRPHLCLRLHHKVGQCPGKWALGEIGERMSH